MSNDDFSFCYDFLFRRVSVPTTQSSSMGSTEQRKVVVAGSFYLLSHVHMLHAAPLPEASAAPLPELKPRPPTGFGHQVGLPGAGSTAKDQSLQLSPVGDKMSPNSRNE